MNTADAAYQTVHDYPGGSESLGPRLGMSPAVLRNKVNPNNTTHKLTLDEAVSIVEVTGDQRILHAFAADCGKVVQDVAPVDTTRPLLDFVLGSQVKGGQLSAALQEALADGVISENEMSLISSAAFANLEAVLGILSRLRAAQKAPA